jgi:hypothetical protein
LCIRAADPNGSNRFGNYSSFFEETDFLWQHIFWAFGHPQLGRNNHRPIFARLLDLDRNVPGFYLSTRSFISQIDNALVLGCQVGVDF